MSFGSIIDAHCHTGSAGILSKPGEADSSFIRYVQRAAEAGISQSVVMAPPVGDYVEANRTVRDIVIAHPGRFLPFLFVNPLDDRGRIGDLVAWGRSWGVCGIKVHWSDGMVTREIAEVARTHRVPVLYDPKGDIDIVRWAAREYPDVAWIIPHLSSFPDDWRAQMALVIELSTTPNLFTDTSGVRYFDILVEAVERAGASKVLFGSDGPYLHPAVELAKIRALKLNPRDHQLVTGGNLRRLVASALRGQRRKGGNHVLTT